MTNKDVVNKFKPEFNHWLTGGTLLGRVTLSEERNSAWSKLSIVSWASNEVVYIINDKYVKFRKALAENKTVEHNLCNGKVWYPMERDVFIDPLSFAEGSPCYRIKPDEPTFKVGDWATFTTHGMKKITDVFRNEGLKLDMLSFNSKYDVYVEADATLWKPESTKWCWSELYGLVKVLQKNTTGDYRCATFSGSESNITTLEPFVGTLPTYVKDK